jgi:hypothetical protein
MACAAAMAQQLLASAHLQYISKIAGHAASTPTPLGSSATELQTWHILPSFYSSSSMIPQAVNVLLTSYSSCACNDAYSHAHAAGTSNS